MHICVTTFATKFQDPILSVTNVAPTIIKGRKLKIISVAYPQLA
jgi:hypothetical protein